MLAAPINADLKEKRHLMTAQTRPDRPDRLAQALELGQSIWYDNLRRGLLVSGELQALVDAGVRDLTSNRTIFEKAIVASADYEEGARNATTLGYGPRFLHSTGQLHEGGANNGVFLQLVADARQDLPVPGEAYSFAGLRDAQAQGDLQVLRRRGRRALRVDLSTFGNDVEAGLAALLASIEKA
jgi:hypothetical protein